MHLTQREKEIAILVCEDKSNKEIGNLLNLSHRTIAFHRKNISEKLGVNNPIAFYRRCMEVGIVQPPNSKQEQLDGYRFCLV